MTIQAEISLYPLRTDDLGHAIGRFLGRNECRWPGSTAGQHE